MSNEIEAKIKVTDLTPVADGLKQLGAERLAELRQVDTYFMDMHKFLYKNDCGLRIRREEKSGTQTACITFKGACTKGKYKSRPEYETGISDPDIMERIFESLGYTKRMKIEKKRILWQLDDCQVCLDELPRLGCFVEVEGPNEEAITAVLKKLNLHNEPHIAAGYASLMANELKQEGIQQTDVFLPS